MKTINSYNTNNVTALVPVVALQKQKITKINCAYKAVLTTRKNKFEKIYICFDHVKIETFSFLGPTEVINCYLLSLAVADLLCGLFVIPFSVYPAVVKGWVYGDVVCRVVGYLEVTLLAVTVYTFMWISVDRYLAVRKPLRYETLQTKTR